MKFEDIIKFWFEELTPKNWFSKDTTVDEKIREKFSQIYRKAAQGELFDWRTTAHGRLAEIIILDQFPRNMFRGSALAFSTDSQALILAQEAVLGGWDHKLTTSEKAFLYMPYMHSESILIHEEAMRLFSQPGLEFNLEFEIQHKNIIERFGRYPHRNELLGRTSSPEEVEFLKQDGSSF